MDDPVVCLEFFSGIGGLHYGFEQSGVPGTVAMAFDMNENANTVYEHNFGLRPNNRAIDYLETADIDKYSANCWLLSPPCQPYTRGGKYLDDEDDRARGLIHLIEMLPKLRNVPRYVFLENVMNFENSRSRTRLVETLGTLGFEVNECLVSPVQMGVPNNRLRYFLIAQRRWAADDAENAARTTKYLARGADAVHKDWPFGPAVESIDGVSAIPLSSYIDASLDAVESLRVPQSAILKRQRLEFDIVRASSAQTSTFTKSYGSRNLIGSGSLLQTRNLDVVENGFGAPERLLDLGIRFFSPKEVALLHHFPYRAPDSPVADGRHYLEFPASLTQRQQLQLLGNSLNVKVVAELIRHILFA